MNKTISPEQLTSRIMIITDRIQHQLPALYALLEETPLFIRQDMTGVSPCDYEQYLDTLTEQFWTMHKSIPAATVYKYPLYPAYDRKKRLIKPPKA